MRKNVVTFEFVKYPVYSLKEHASHTFIREFAAVAAALVLLGIFTGWNFFLHERSVKKSPDKGDVSERDHYTDTAGWISRRLAFHDFEWGNPADTAAHLATHGHGGKQSFIMGAGVPYSPGLWTRFKDLNPGDSSWIRVTGFVWFSFPAAGLKCNLVATCNHKGLNYKYMFVDLGRENLKPGQWNKVGIDYRIPTPPDPEDVLQAYFWYRGGGEMLVDDINIEIFTPAKLKENHE